MKSGLRPFRGLALRRKRNANLSGRVSFAARGWGSAIRSQSQIAQIRSGKNRKRADDRALLGWSVWKRRPRPALFTGKVDRRFDGSFRSSESVFKSGAREKITSLASVLELSLADIITQIPRRCLSWWPAIFLSCPPLRRKRYLAQRPCPSWFQRIACCNSSLASLRFNLSLIRPR